MSVSLAEAMKEIEQYITPANREGVIKEMGERIEQLLPMALLPQREHMKATALLLWNVLELCAACHYSPFALLEMQAMGVEDVPQPVQEQ